MASTTEELNSSSYGLDPRFQVRVNASAPDSQLNRDMSDLFALLKRGEAHPEP
jgi:hypothetical protein